MSRNLSQGSGLDPADTGESLEFLLISTVIFNENDLAVE